MYDTPITDDLLHAALVSMGDNLAENVVLPPNIKLLSENADLLDCFKAFIGDFSKFSAIYQCWAMSEYEGNATMVRAFKNWVATCDQLVVNPHFMTGWKLPAFFPVYKMYCEGACREFFDLQRELYPHKVD